MLAEILPSADTAGKGTALLDSEGFYSTLKRCPVARIDGHSIAASSQSLVLCVPLSQCHAALCHAVLGHAGGVPSKRDGAFTHSFL